MVKPTIVVEKVAGNPSRAVRRLFESFADLPCRIGTCKKVFIKINAVYFHPHLQTSLSLIESVVQYMKTLDPRKQIYVMDANGRNQKKISNTTWAEYDPIWIK